MNYLKLIRYQNLLMLALMQLIFRYGFLELQNIPLALADWQYVLLVLATVCIAAGGYIINNIMDVETDTENKPENVIVGKFISETKAYNLYIGFTVIGVAIGFLFVECYRKTQFCIHIYSHCGDALFLCHEFETKFADWQFYSGFVAFV